MEKIIALLYGLTPLISSYAYIPQVRKLLAAPSAEARCISVGAWALWLGSAVIALLYGLVHLGDTLFCIVAGISCFWCTTILTIILYKKHTDSKEPILLAPEPFMQQPSAEQAPLCAVSISLPESAVHPVQDIQHKA